MIVKVKWLPWIMIGSGILGLITGVAIVFSILLLVGGIIWAVSRVSGQKSTPTNSTSQAYGNPPVYTAPTCAEPPEYTAPPAAPTMNTAPSCPYCGNPDIQAMIYCNQCGAKLS